MKPFYSVFSVLLYLVTFAAIGQEDLRAYHIYNKKGEVLTFSEVANELTSSEVILFGESHNNSIVHWLQYELCLALNDSTKRKLVLGAEMFESDDQIAIDEYLTGKIDSKYFEKEVKLWNNYKTDYRPLVEFAKSNNYRFIATNVPRRYAHMIAHNGVGILNEVDKSAQSFFAPLPLEADSTIPGYAALYQMSHGSKMSGENFMYAQAIKDATMAHFISENLIDNSIFIHFNGDYHSKNYGGIYHYLKKGNKKLKVNTISVVEDASLLWNKDYSGLGDYIIVTSKNITKTY